MIQTELLRAAGVDVRDIDQLEEAWEAYQRVVDQPLCQTPRIVCTGIYNAGKSTLLNALCGEEKFPTGDIPTTKEIAQAEFDGAVYVDTPGLNAKDEDDRETLAAYYAADFILFVASAQNGGVSEAEAGWLKRLETRYTADSLGRRLVYVLTHCGQVEPEELAEIEARVRENLEKVLGFTPERIFCVDSVTYQNGRKEGENLLAEHSGIPEFQTYFAKRIAGAGETLRQAQADETEARRRELLEQIGQRRVFLEQKLERKTQKIQDKIATVDAIWSELDAELETIIPKDLESRSSFASFLGLHSESTEKDDRPIYVYTVHLRQKSSHGSVKSESEAKRRLKNDLSSVYNAREQVIQQLIRLEDDTIKYCCTDGLDSRYFSQRNRASQALEQAVLKLQKLGISVSKLEELVASPDIPSNLYSEIKSDLADGVVEYGGYYSLDKYIDMYARIEEGTSYEKGMFGKYRDVPVYYYDDYRVIDEMEKDLQKNWKSNVTGVNRRLNNIWQNFLIKLAAEVNDRKAVLKSRVDAYRSTLEQGSDTAEIEAAISHLDALKEEVSQ